MILAVKSAPSPAVCFVVIAHNEELHAPITVRSILRQQTNQAFEIVFVDDGSTDHTVDAVKAAANGDARLRLVCLATNVGRGAARASGVEAARSALIAFVDADITLPPHWLEQCLQAIPQKAAVGGTAVPDGDVAVVARVSGATARAVPSLMPITGNNVLFRAEVLQRSGFDPRDRLGEDFRLAGRLIRDGYSLARVPGLTVRHEEARSYRSALRWRFDNGVDAVTHPVELRRVRQADLAWLACGVSTVGGVVGALIASPWWLFLGPVVIAAAALVHVTARFEPRPFAPFLLAWIADVPLMASYVLGRTVGLPRLLRRA
jgi:glycosyltransferase involved in cell wall biosynthesis